MEDLEKVDNRDTSKISKVSTEVVGYNRKVVNTHRRSPKAYTYDEPLLAQMTSRFHALVYTMGFEDPVEKDTMQVLILWITEQFGDLSMNEMIMAFQMAAAHKLPGAPKHYRNFDMQYVGDVLNAYKSYRNQQLKIFEDEEAANRAMESNGVSLTGQEMYDAIKTVVMGKGEIMKMADWSNAFKYAESEGLIDQMTDAEKKKYRDKVAATLKKEAVKSPDYRRLLNTLTEKTSLRQECRKRILQDHFQKMIDDNKSKEDK